MRVAYFLQQIFNAMVAEMKRNSLHKIKNNMQKFEQMYFLEEQGEFLKKQSLGMWASIGKYQIPEKYIFMLGKPNC